MGLMKTGAFAVAMVAATSVLAEDERRVPANKTTEIGFIAVWIEGTCENTGKIYGKVVTPPKHGKVVFVWTTSNGDNIPSACRNLMKGTSVRYTPNSGYRGPDSFVVSYQIPRYENDGTPNSTRARVDVVVD